MKNRRWLSQFLCCWTVCVCHTVWCWRDVFCTFVERLKMGHVLWACGCLEGSETQTDFTFSSYPNHKPSVALHHHNLLFHACLVQFCIFALRVKVIECNVLKTSSAACYLPSKIPTPHKRKTGLQESCLTLFLFFVSCNLSIYLSIGITFFLPVFYTLFPDQCIPVKADSYFIIINWT